MKKTFIFATLAFGLATSATASTLQYGLNFNNMGNNGVTFDNLGSGATEVTNANTGYANWSDTDTPLGDSGYAHGVHGRTFTILNNEGIDGLSFDEGFSLGLHVKFGSDAWKDALSLKIDNTIIRIETTGSGWTVYGGSGIGLNDTALITGVTSSDWSHLGLTFQGSTMQVFANGALQTTLTLNTTTASLIQEIRGCCSGRGGNNILIDNLAVYDGVLTAENMAYLAANAAPSSFAASGAVPEPTTATLSLLALAGLAARRRRK